MNRRLALWLLLIALFVPPRVAAQSGIGYGRNQVTGRYVSVDLRDGTRHARVIATAVRESRVVILEDMGSGELRIPFDAIERISDMSGRDVTSEYLGTDSHGAREAAGDGATVARAPPWRATAAASAFWGVPFGRWFDELAAHAGWRLSAMVRAAPGVYVTASYRYQPFTASDRLIRTVENEIRNAQQASSVEVTAFDFTMQQVGGGLRFAGPFGRDRRAWVYGGGGFAYARQEVATDARVDGSLQSEHVAQSDFGLYAEGGIIHMLADHFGLEGGGRLDWVQGKTDVVEASGFTLEIALGVLTAF